MKLLIIAALVTFVVAQNPVPVQRCYDGEIINGVEVNVTMIDCGGEGMGCQTKIEINHGYKKVEKRCKQTEACVRNTANNAQNCYSASAIDKQVRVCFVCCDGDLCNLSNDIPPVVVEPLEPEIPEEP